MFFFFIFPFNIMLRFIGMFILNRTKTVYLYSIALSSHQRRIWRDCTKEPKINIFTQRVYCDLPWNGDKQIFFLSVCLFDNNGV